MAEVPITHKIVLSAEYFPFTQGHTHPLELVLKDDYIRDRTDGIWIPLHMANRSEEMMELGSVCSGRPFTKYNFVATDPYEDSEHGGHNKIEDTGPTPIPFVINASLDGGAPDVVEQVGRFMNFVKGKTAVTISPSARGVGASAIKRAFAKEIANDELDLYLIATYPEDDPEDVALWELSKKVQQLEEVGLTPDWETLEGEYTQLIAYKAQEIGFTGVVAFAGLAKSTLQQQKLIAMGVTRSGEGYHTLLPHTIDEYVYKRAKTPSAALEGASFDENGVCNTTLLLGRAVTHSLEGDKSIHTDIKWNSDLGGDIIADMQENIRAIILEAEATIRS